MNPRPCLFLLPLAACALLLAGCGEADPRLAEENARLQEQLAALEQEKTALATELEQAYADSRRDLTRFDRMMADLSTKVTQQRTQLDAREREIARLRSLLGEGPPEREGGAEPEPARYAGSAEAPARPDQAPEDAAPGADAREPRQHPTVDELRNRLAYGSRVDVILALGNPDEALAAGSQWRYDDAVFDRQAGVDRDLLVSFEGGQVRAVEHYRD